MCVWQKQYDDAHSTCELHMRPHISSEGYYLAVLQLWCWQYYMSLRNLCANDTFAFQVSEYEQNIAVLKGNFDDYSRDLNRLQGAHASCSACTVLPSGG